MARAKLSYDEREAQAAVSRAMILAWENRTREAMYGYWIEAAAGANDEARKAAVANGKKLVPVGKRGMLGKGAA